MRQFPKLRPCGWDALIVLAVVLLAAACGVMVWGNGGGTEQLTVVVSIDGAEADRFELEGTDLPDRKTYYGNGYTLEVSLRPDGESGVRVEHADCPTQDCVHTGTIHREGQSIVCLPARIVIRLEGGNGDDSGVDAVVG